MVIPLVAIAGLASLSGHYSSHDVLPLLLPDNPPVSLQRIENSAIGPATAPSASSALGETRTSPCSEPLPANHVGCQWNGLSELLVTARGR